MGHLASDMWRAAVDSWYQRDRPAAAVLGPSAWTVSPAQPIRPVT
jgi:hypothetical protein